MPALILALPKGVKIDFHAPTYSIIVSDFFLRSIAFLECVLDESPAVSTVSNLLPKRGITGMGILECAR